MFIIEVLQIRLVVIFFLNIMVNIFYILHRKLEQSFINIICNNYKFFKIKIIKIFSITY